MLILARRSPDRLPPACLACEAQPAIMVRGSWEGPNRGFPSGGHTNFSCHSLLRVRVPLGSWIATRPLVSVRAPARTGGPWCPHEPFPLQVDRNVSTRGPQCQHRWRSAVSGQVDHAVRATGAQCPGQVERKVRAGGPQAAWWPATWPRRPGLGAQPALLLPSPCAALVSPPRHGWTTWRPVARRLRLRG